MKIQVKANILELKIYVIVLAYVSTFISSIMWAKDVWHIPMTYIILAILFDQMTRFITPSPIDKKDLSEKYKITQNQLDKYAKSKRDYRIFAAGISAMIATFMWAFNYSFGFYFAISFMVIWLFYLPYRIFILKTPAPKIQNHEVSHFSVSGTRNSLTWDGIESNRVRNMWNSMNTSSFHSRSFH